MAERRSRYADARPFEGTAFAGLRPRPVGRPDGAVEHRVRRGDRLDLLAHEYYNDDRLWWWIADANPEAVEAGELVAADGRAILIPAGRTGRG